MKFRKLGKAAGYVATFAVYFGSFPAMIAYDNHVAKSTISRLESNAPYLGRDAIYHDTNNNGKLETFVGDQTSGLFRVIKNEDGTVKLIPTNTGVLIPANTEVR